MCHQHFNGNVCFMLMWLTNKEADVNEFEGEVPFWTICKSNTN